jgi:hypothetical protein
VYDDAAVRPGCLLVAVVLAVAFTAGGPSTSRADERTVRTPSDVPPAPGGALGMRYRIERIRVVGNRWTHRDVVKSRLPFRRGQILDVDDPELEASRLRLLATGYFAEVQLDLQRGTRRGWVVLVARVRERGTIRLQDIALGVGEQGWYGGLDVADANFLGIGRSAGAAFVAGGDQQAFRLRYLDPDVLTPRTTFQAIALYNHARDYFGAPEVTASTCPDPDQPCSFAAALYDRAGATLGLGSEVADALRLHLRTRAELIHVRERPVSAATRRRGHVRSLDIDVHPGTSVLTSLALGLEYDTRSDPFLPARGVRVWSDAEVSSIGTASEYGYARLTAGLESYHRMPWKHVLKVDLFAGIVVGDAPFFDQFFVGDLSDLVPSRVLDLALDARASPNFLGTVVGEMRYQDLAARAALEYAVPLLRDRAIVYGVDFYVGAGLFLLGDVRDLTLSRPGYSGLARAPVDVTFDVGFRVDTEAGVFVLSISNLAGLIPLRGAGP